MHCFIFRTALPHTFQIRLPVSEYRGTDETGIPVRAGQMPGVVKNGANGSYPSTIPSAPPGRMCGRCAASSGIRIRFRYSRQTPGPPASWSQRPFRGRRPSAEPPSRRRRWPGSRRSSKATHACRSGVRRRPSRGPRSRPHLVKPRIPCSSKMAFTRSVSAWLYDKNTAFIVPINFNSAFHFQCLLAWCSAERRASFSRSLRCERFTRIE